VREEERRREKAYSAKISLRKKEGTRKDGREKGVEQILPAGFRSGEDPTAETAEEPADEGAHDASHEHSLWHLWKLHLQRHQVQFPQGRRHRRGWLLCFLFHPSLLSFSDRDSVFFVSWCKERQCVLEFYLCNSS
jgi:hypothetical protein